jgi:hypothetical protein
MPRDRTIGLAAIALGAIVLPAIARADVTVIYAPAAASAPLIARPVAPGVDRSATIEPLTERVDPPRLAVAEPQRPILPLAPRELSLPPAVAPREPVPAVDAPEPAPILTPPPPAALPPAPTCPAPVVLVRATDGREERASLPLLGCDGAPDPESLVALSILARPRALPRPTARELADHASHAELVAPGVRRLHPGLLERVRAIADRFPGHAIEIVSGFRPDARAGSRHLHGLALDLRVAGASLDAVHAFVSRFDRTGIGLHPVAGFLHVDVRERATHWTDESAQGEPPRVSRTDDAPRGARVGAATQRAPATPSPAADTIEADAIADEVLRGLGDLSLPRAPLR